MAKIEIETAELDGEYLDLALALAVGQQLEKHGDAYYVPGHCGDSWTSQQYFASRPKWEPRTNGNQLMPLIGRFGVSLYLAGHSTYGPDKKWAAAVGRDGWVAFGPTPEIALMRAIILDTRGSKIVFLESEPHRPILRMTDTPPTGE